MLREHPHQLLGTALTGAEYERGLPVAVLVDYALHFGIQRLLKQELVAARAEGERVHPQRGGPVALVEVLHGGRFALKPVAEVRQVGQRGTACKFIAAIISDPFGAPLTESNDSQWQPAQTVVHEKWNKNKAVSLQPLAWHRAEGSRGFRSAHEQIAESLHPHDDGLQRRAAILSQVTESHFSGCQREGIMVGKYRRKSTLTYCDYYNRGLCNELKAISQVTSMTL